MKLLTLMKDLTPVEKTELAEKLGTTPAYLSQLAHGHRRAGASILMKVESATGGKVTANDLRPDLQETAA